MAQPPRPSEQMDAATVEAPIVTNEMNVGQRKSMQQMRKDRSFLQLMP